MKILEATLDGAVDITSGRPDHPLQKLTTYKPDQPPYITSMEYDGDCLVITTKRPQVEVVTTEQIIETDDGKKETVETSKRVVTHVVDLWGITAPRIKIMKFAGPAQAFEDNIKDPGLGSGGPKGVTSLTGNSSTKPLPTPPKKGKPGR